MGFMLGAKSRCRSDSFLLQRARRIANCDALIQILLKKLLKSTESLILQRVDKLVENQSAIAPTIRPDENSMASFSWSKEEIQMLL